VSSKPGAGQYDGGAQDSKGNAPLGVWRGFDTYQAPAPPENYQLDRIQVGKLLSAVGQSGGQISVSVVDATLDTQGIDPVANTFTPTGTNWDHWWGSGGYVLNASWTITFIYRPTDAYLDFITRTNQRKTFAYKLALEKRDYIKALHDRLAECEGLTQRSADDLREEERSVVIQRVIREVFQNLAATDPKNWSDADWHVAAEHARHLFDLDRLLYFVSPEWFRKSVPGTFDNTQNERSSTRIDLRDTVAWGSKHILPEHLQKDIGLFNEPFFGYLVTKETKPAPMGASLGWLIQLDADERRDAFINSPWVKIVIPIRPFREREALRWLSHSTVEGASGLSELYQAQPGDPSAWSGQTLEYVLNDMADTLNQQHQDASTPTALKFAGEPDPQRILPTEKVFEHGFDPLAGGLELGAKAFEVFSQWTEILPTDQVVAVTYKVADAEL
jgi:hypothetical protein